VNLTQRQIKALMMERGITIAAIAEDLNCRRELVSSCIAGRVRSEAVRAYLISKLGPQPELEKLLPLPSRRSTKKMRKKLAACLPDEARSINKAHRQELQPHQTPQALPPFGKRLRWSRKNQNWSQGQLAKKCHVSSSCISKIERGTDKPSNYVIAQLAIALDINIAWLKNGKGPRNLSSNRPFWEHHIREWLTELTPTMDTWTADLLCTELAQRIKELQR